MSGTRVDRTRGSGTRPGGGTHLLEKGEEPETVTRGRSGSETGYYGHEGVRTYQRKRRTPNLCVSHEKRSSTLLGRYKKKIFEIESIHIDDK